MRPALLVLAAFPVVFPSAGCKKDAAPPPAAAAAPAAPAGPSVGLVFDVGGRGDKSFNDAADRGLTRAHKELAARVEVVEPGEGVDREAALRQLAARKLDLVIGVGFLFTDDINRMAADFPQQKFACVDYTVTPGKPIPPNVLALKFKEEEGSFLVGALAALLSKGNKLGFVGGMEIPLIHKFRAGYTAGARHVRPDAEVLVTFAGVTGEAFANPGKGKELALSLYGKGVDIIYHAAGSTGLGVFEAARAQKKLAIGVDSDQWAEAPGVVLTSMVKQVDVAVFDAVKAVQDGTFKGGVRELDLKGGGVDYIYDEHNKALIPDDVRAKVEALRAEIVAGRIAVPNQ
ncbi:MAG: BMP family ABC transporter substrate-binding protein [Deltaproteobacteria bacterium]|nr:BMP family ABC transporter substrate-binding protein [Deltaproteobacteria bacterium]